MTVWRVCKDEYKALDGAGAKLYGGRWNRAGVAVVYAAECLPLATAEHRVHYGVQQPGLVWLKIRVILKPSAVEEVRTLPDSWQDDEEFTQNIGTAWASSGRSLVLSVPSKAVPESRNFLINPNHSEAARRVRIEEWRPYRLDSRLFTVPSVKTARH